jgi:SAM-dependent methyltransferase
MSGTTHILQAPEDWNGQWKKWFAQYSKGNPRLGKWLDSRYSIKGKKTLEIGAGSGRESRYLAPTAMSVTCVDFSPEAVGLLEASRLPSNMEAVQASAETLPFPARSFDITFHKGLWIYFEDDRQLRALMREQLRVTRKVALAIVQNALNTNQVAQAKAKAANDPLFNFRWFKPSELDQLADRALSSLGMNAKIRILKYGNPSLSRFLSPLGTFGDRSASMIYPFLPWSRVECAALEIVLDP